MFDKDLCPIGMVALCHAIKNPPMFRLLLDRGIHINPESTASIVLRTKIARSGSKELTDMLREKGYLVEISEEHQAYTSLSAADPEANNLRLIASVNPTALYVMNALQYAITRGDIVTVTYLLECGCDANPEGFIQPDDPSIVELAVRIPNPETAAAMLNVLIRHGANINALKGSSQSEWSGHNKDEQHQTAIQLLIERAQGRTRQMANRLRIPCCTAEITFMSKLCSICCESCVIGGCLWMSSKYIKESLTSKRRAATVGVLRGFWRIFTGG